MILGNPLRFKNDILTINKIEISGAFLTITTNETFNGEYRNKDLIKIKVLHLQILIINNF